MRLSAAHCGDIDLDLGILEGRGHVGVRRVPSMCFVIEFGNQVVVWDTSMHPCLSDDPIGYWGPVAEQLVVPHLDGESTLLARLRLLGIRAGDLTLVVNSHLHNDHCGMNRFFPNATVLVRRLEYEHAVAVMDNPMSGYVRNDFFGDGQRLELIDYDQSFDLLGDGRLQLLSTIGHTPGHQSLLVTFDSGRSFLLSGDAVYSDAQLRERRAPGLVADRVAAERSVGRVAELAAGGTTVLVAHDPAAWSAVTDVATVWEEP